MAHKFKLMPVPERGASDNLLRGTINLSAGELHKFAPQYTGHSQIFVMKMPSFMENYSIDTNHPLFQGKDMAALKNEANKHAKNLKNLIEFASLSYSGTPDLSMNTGTVETGYSGVEVTVPTNTAYDGTSFSIKVLEQRGEPLRKGLEFYASGLFDPYGYVGHLHGSDHPFGPQSYAWEIVIVQFDPTMREVQDISYWQNVIPKPVDRSNLDWNQGSVDVVSPKDVQFTGRYVADANTLLNDDSFQSILQNRLKLIKLIGQFNLNV